ncbi:MAG: response regulator [Candidatus Nitrosopolaris sp.]
MICKVVSPVGYEQQQRQQQIIDSNNRSKNRILIVDDEKPDYIATLKLNLEKSGFIVDTLADPLVALDNFRAGLFDMVVLDKRMSKMNAVYLHKKFKKLDDRVIICRICILGSSEMY